MWAPEYVRGASLKGTHKGRPYEGNAKNKKQITRGAAPKHNNE